MESVKVCVIKNCEYKSPGDIGGRRNRRRENDSSAMHEKSKESFVGGPDLASFSDFHGRQATRSLGFCNGLGEEEMSDIGGADAAVE